MKKNRRETLGKVLTLFLGIICFLGITAAARQELPIFKAMIEAGGSIVWEGATRNAYQTTITVADPTADQTITFPNSSGTPLLSVAAQGAANSVTIVSNGIEFEGSSVDVHETTLDVANPTADVTYRLPVAAAGTYSVMSSTLATNAPDVANSVTGGTNSLIFEGSGVDAFEHTIIGTNPTIGDQVWTLPDFAVAVTGSFMFSTLATNGPDIANSVTGASNALKWEGTADEFECTLDSADQTADVTYRMPVAAAGTYSVMSSTLVTNAPDVANSVTGGTNSLIFEGSGVDAFEHTIIGTNPTVGDQIWTMPDFAVAATGSFMFSSLVTNGPDIANSVTGGTNGLIFEGATANDFETTITPTDPTADHTITLPDQSGTVVTTPYVGDITASADTTGGNAGAINQLIGVVRGKMVGIGTMANGTTNTVITDIGDSETPATDWTAVDGDTTMSNDSTYYRHGTASLKMAVADTADATDGCTNALASGDQDWTDDEAFGMWIYTDKALDAGDLVLQIHDATAAGGFTAVNFPAITANAWQWIELDVTLGNNNLKDVITDLSIVLSAAGAVQAAAGAFNVYFDFIVKWDVAEEETLGESILQDGVTSLVETAVGGTSLVLYTDYFVHYQSGNDAIVIMTDQSGAGKAGVAWINY